MQRRQLLPLPLILTLTLLITLSLSLPTTTPDGSPPPTSKKVLPPRYHVIFNLLWAFLTATQLVAGLKVLKLPLPDNKTKSAYRFACAAMATRLASYLFTAAFAQFVLPNWNWAARGGGSSLLGTFADAFSWAADGLLVTAVFKVVHDKDHDQPLTLPSWRNLDHETFDRILIRCFWVWISILSIISFVYPAELSGFGYGPLLIAYAVYLQVLLVMTVDCIAWSGIISRRIKNKGAVYTEYARGAPYVGGFLVGIWILRAIQSPEPFFVMDIYAHILAHGFFYSMIFCFMIGASKEKDFLIYSSVLFVLTFVLFIYVGIMSKKVLR